MQRSHRTGRWAPLCAGGALLALCLSHVPTSGAEPSPRQAPEWREMVARGELPPLAERLPEKPFVVDYVDEIGRYGGEMRRAHLGPQDAFGATYVVKEMLLIFSHDYQRILPCLAKSYEASADYRTFTFHLRKGIRWSDGVPLTADDYMFWYEHEALNREITPVPNFWLARDGEFMRMEKLDDFSFRITFSKPYTVFPDYISGVYAPEMRRPAHYAKQFHPAFQPEEEIERLTREGGYAHWVDMYKKKTYYVENVECPVLHAWIASEGYTGAVQRWKRNPYYWKVDKAGNQLPYIDSKSYFRVSDPEALLLRAYAGEIDLQARRIAGINVSGIENYPFLAKGAADGGYRLVVRNMFRQIKYGLLLNYDLGLATGEDSQEAERENRRVMAMSVEELKSLDAKRRTNEMKRRLFNDFDFRRALSHAINRDEINAFCLQGLGTPAQFAAHPDSRWFEKEALEAHIAFDPELAGELLDKLGLDRWDEKREFRLLPTGDALVVFIRVQGPNIEAMELVREMWGEVGVRATVSPVQTNYWYQMNQNGNYDVTCAAPVAGWDGCYRHALVAPPYGWPYAAPQWYRYYATNGKVGRLPPDWVQEMYRLGQETLVTPRGPRQIELIKRQTRLWAENLMCIGTVMSPPEATFAVVNARMRNVPDPLPFLQAAHPSAFFYTEE